MSCRPVLLPFTLAVALASAASAGTINSNPLSVVYSGPAVTNANVFPLNGDPPAAPNNDNQQLASPNRIDITKDIFGMAAPIDITFEVFNSGGVTEYFINEAVGNSTGIAWDGYFIQLGYGVLGGFQLSNPWDHLDFDAPFRDPQPTSDIFAAAYHSSNELIFFVGPFNPLDFGSFVLSVDVPDFNAQIPDGAQIYDQDGNVIGYRFILRQIPVVLLPGGGAAGGDLVFQFPPFNPRGPGNVRPPNGCPAGQNAPQCEDNNVPEPASVLLLGPALAALLAVRRIYPRSSRRPKFRTSRKSELG